MNDETLTLDDIFISCDRYLTGDRRSGHDRREVTKEQIEYLRVVALRAIQAGRAESVFILGDSRSRGLLPVWHQLGRKIYREIKSERKAVA